MKKSYIFTCLTFIMLLNTTTVYKSWTKLSKYQLGRKTHLTGFRKRSDIELMAELNEKTGGCQYEAEFQSILTNTELIQNCSSWLCEFFSFL